MADEKIVLTRSGYEHIQRQLTALETAEINQQTLPGDNTPGRDDADVSAESEWRMNRALIEERIASLRYTLERAEIYEDSDPAHVNTGERITLWDFEENEEVQYDLLSSAEIATQANVGPGVRDISDVSPVGQALVGKAVGDVVEVEVPDGRLRYVIRKIEPIPGSTGGQ